MKFIITPYLFYNKFNKICFSINKEWYDLFSKYKSNLHVITYNNKTKLNKKDFIDCNGIILSGGGDLYTFKKNRINFLRDNFEKKIIDLAIKNNIPLLAVCRGYQLVGQKFKFKLKKINSHVNNHHFIRSQDKKQKIKVNSYHKFAVIKLNSDFEKLFSHDDGSIEICQSKKRGILCFMFHPERFSQNQKIIDNLIKKWFKIK